MRASKRSKPSTAPKDWDDDRSENEWDCQAVASAPRFIEDEWDVISRGKYICKSRLSVSQLVRTESQSGEAYISVSRQYVQS